MDTRSISRARTRARCSDGGTHALICRMPWRESACVNRRRGVEAMTETLASFGSAVNLGLWGNRSAIGWATAAASPDGASLDELGHVLGAEAEAVADLGVGELSSL